MRYFDYLKRTFLPYVLSGIILGLAIFSLIVINRYNDYLLKTLEVIKGINIDRVRSQMVRMDEWRGYLKDLRLDATAPYSEILLFQTLDDIKTNIRGASITVTTVEDAKGEKVLPVRLVVPVKNYKMLLDYVGYIEAFSIPRYKVSRFSISRGPGGDLILNIEGSLRMPSVEAKGNEGAE